MSVTVRLHRLGAREIDHEMIWGAIALLALAASRFLDLAMLPRLACPLHEIAGIPCPTCGITRCFLSFARGDFAGALAMNPAGAILLGLLVFYVPYTALVVCFRLPRPRIRVSGRFWPAAARIGAVSALLANWAYLVAVGR